MLTYIPVSFLFSFKNFVPVRVKNRVGVWVSFRVRLGSRVRVRIGNLIGGAAAVTSYACASAVAGRLSTLVDHTTV